MWAFIARVAALAWKYGAAVINRVIAWIQANWRAVVNWINLGWTVEQITEHIIRYFI